MPPSTSRRPHARSQPCRDGPQRRAYWACSASKSETSQSSASITTPLCVEPPTALRPPQLSANGTWWTEVYERCCAAIELIAIPGETTRGLTRLEIVVTQRNVDAERHDASAGLALTDLRV